MKTSKIHSLFGVLLALLIIIGAVPLTTIDASAASIVSTISIIGVEAPVPGEKPNYSAYPSGAYSLSSDLDDGNRVNGICWSDSTTNKMMKPTDYFIAGHTYSLSIIVKAYSSCEFKMNGTTPDVTASINSESAKVNQVYQKEPKSYLAVYRSMGECGNKSVTLSNVSLRGVTAPFPGRKPTYNAYNATSGYRTSKVLDDSSRTNGITWIDNTTNSIIDKNTAFIAGHSYSISMYIESLDGYRFAVDTSGKPTFSGYINSKSANKYVIGGQTASKRVAIGVSFGECKNSVWTTASVEIDMPTPGKTPSYTATMGSSVYKLCKDHDDSTTNNGITWVDTTDNKIMKPTDKFVAGHKYTVSVLIETITGYEFKVDSSNKPDVTATINAVTAGTNSVYKKEPNKCISVSRNFGECKNTAINSISVINITAPKSNAKPSYTFGNVYPAQYTVKNTTNSDTGLKNGIRWMDSKGNFLSPDSTFVSGEQYTVGFYVQANEGYEFVVNSSGDPAVTASVNLAKAEAIKVYNTAPQSQLYIRYKFPAATGETISTVNVSAVNPPSAGSAPSYSATPASSSYRVFTDVSMENGKNGIFWYDKDTSQRLNPGTDKFKAGHSYQVNVAVFANPGYEFPVDTQGHLTVTGLINNNKCGVTGLYGYSVKSAIVLSYQFDPCEKETIKSIIIKDVVKPKTDEKPTYKATVSTEGCSVLTSFNNYNFKDGVRFYDAESYEYVLPDGGVFEAEKEYRCNVMVQTDENHKFDKTNTITASINGIDATAYSWDSVGSAENVLNIQCTFPKTEAKPAQPKDINEVRIKDIVEPKAGKIPSFNANVKADSGYFLLSNSSIGEAVEWYHADTHELMYAYDGAEYQYDKFEAGKKYICEVYLASEDGYQFTVDSSSNPSVKGYINNKSASVTKMNDVWDAKDDILVIIEFECPKTEQPKEMVTVKYETFGHGVSIADEKVEKGKPAPKPEMPEIGGSIQFAGWYADEKCTIEYDFSQPVMTDITIYAKWVDTSAPTTKKLYGDMDGDGDITSADSLIILRASIKLVTLNDEETKLADVDGDGQITSADALEVLRKSVKLSTTSKAGQPFEG